MFSLSLNWVLAVSLLASLSEGRPGTPSLTPEVRQVDFGQVLIGSSVARSIRLRSRYGPVTLKSAFLEGGQRLSFALSYRARGNEVLVGIGNTLDVSLAFSPARAARHKTRLMARMTEGDSTGFPVELTGAGTFRISELDSVRLTGGPAAGPLSLGTARTDIAVRFTPRRRGPHLAALVLRDRDGRRLGMTLSGAGR